MPCSACGSDGASPRGAAAISEREGQRVQGSAEAELAYFLVVVCLFVFVFALRR